MRIGVGIRLLMAFFGITAFSLLAAAAAIYSFTALNKLMDGITEEQVPSALASLEISRQSERIANVAPALLTASTPGEHKTLKTRIAAEVKRLHFLLNELTTGKFTATTSMASVTLAIIVQELEENIQSLNEVIAGRLAVRAREKAHQENLLKTHSETRKLLAPWLLIVDAEISELKTVVNDLDVPDSKRAASGAQLGLVYVQFRALRRVELLASRVNDTLVQATSEDDVNRLKVMVFRLKRSFREMAALARTLNPKLRPFLIARVGEFRQLTTLPEGIPQTQEREIQLVRKAQRLLDENTNLTNQLTVAVDKLVNRTKQGIALARKQAQSAQSFSTNVLIAIILLSIVCSVLIVWLYVGRNIVSRLMALSQSMMSIAEGHLDNPIPGGGNDEIGQMAKALAVFRDTAREVRQTNVKEIKEVRRRLTDAIESLSEGFALFDSKDKLVICNEYYRETLYGPAGKVVMAESSFQDIMAAIEDAGILVDKGEPLDSKPATKSAQYAGNTDADLRRFRDGRCILVTGHKTEGGGIVEVHSDITELKMREADLAKKSRQLEHLSRQLAKYIPPQIYELVLLQDRDVQIASVRKKLTVFFSDIAGFTETADRLESEELTALINEYLTEMSKIALNYGGTIDKFMGDGIMIFFGDPETRGVKDDALACVRMAIAMQERLRSLAGVWHRAGIENALLVRMGVHTGYCTVGNFGSEERMDYTIIGSGANTASRLETSAIPGDVLISYETYSHIRDEIECAKAGSIEVKGMAYPVTTYRVIADRHTDEKAKQDYHAHTIHLDLDLSPSEMDEAELEQASSTLKKALQIVSAKKNKESE